MNLYCVYVVFVYINDYAFMLSLGPIRVGFSEGKYQVREDIGSLMIPVELDGGDSSQISLRVFAVDGIAYGNYVCNCITTHMGHNYYNYNHWSFSCNQSSSN